LPPPPSPPPSSQPLSPLSSPPSPVIDATFPADAAPPSERQSRDPAPLRHAGVAHEGDMLDHATSPSAHMDALTDYCTRWSSQEPPLLAELRTATADEYSAGGARMLSDPLQVVLPDRLY
jgi:hypothetical protein